MLIVIERIEERKSESTVVILQSKRIFHSKNQISYSLRPHPISNNVIQLKCIIVAVIFLEKQASFLAKMAPIKSSPNKNQTTNIFSSKNISSKNLS